jgi:beta-N-acetylhexosaminidase
MLIGLEGPELDQATADHLAAGGAGIILFDRNVVSAEQLRALTSAAGCAAEHPLLVAVDQEPGPIARLGDDLVSRLPAPAQALSLQPETWAGVAAVLGEELIALGINMDLAPIVDVVSGSNPVLEGRHFGDDPELVAEFGSAFVEGLAQAGVIGVLKHFPGHGRSATDPHTGVVRIDASAGDLAEADWVPFEMGIEQGARAVMLGHPIYDAIDPELPASISPVVLSLLRTRFAFDGVAITDSLSMPGVAEGRTPGELAVMALAAGEDLLLVEAPFHVEPMLDEIVAAVADGRLSLDRLQEAATRVAALAESAGRVACG